MGNPMTDGTTHAVESEADPVLVAKCQRTLAKHATSPEELAMFMDMLGVLPKEPEPERKPGYCLECGNELPIEAHSPKSGMNGFCSKRCRRINEGRKTGALS